MDILEMYWLLNEQEIKARHRQAKESVEEYSAPNYFRNCFIKSVLSALMCIWFVLLIIIFFTRPFVDTSFISIIIVSMFVIPFALPVCIAVGDVMEQYRNWRDGTSKEFEEAKKEYENLGKIIDRQNDRP